MPRDIHIPPGCWPPRMTPELAAAYVGERSVAAFLRRVGTEYPKPCVDEGTGKGKRQIWNKIDLDRVIGATEGSGIDPPEVL